MVIVRGAAESIAPPGMLPVVVLAEGAETGGPGPDHADAVVAPDDLDAIITRIDRVPQAACALAVLLRSQPERTIEAGLAAESAVYSTLQAGPEFATWRAATSHDTVIDDEPTVSIERVGNELTVTLDRPHRHNAITARLRDDLTAALRIPLADDSITRVVLRGAGPSFCTGGDLAEFGSRPDPATAHMTRLARSPARLVHLLADRTVARLHGFAMGGGIETAAFAGHVVAHRDTRIALPELELGLIPGAGGTMSLTRRMGRQRTALLAFGGETIDAATALSWGLVDAIEV